MISISITADDKDVRAFLVNITGEIRNPKSLNDALGKRLARELQGHFRARNSEPNKMAAAKTNFWSQIGEATAMTEATDAGATVTIAEQRFRIHLYGGVIRPTGGRKFLTIPLIKEARALRVREYERRSGNKLFRLPGTGVLVERTDQGDRSTIAKSQGVIRGKKGFRKVTVRARSLVRAVYALKTSVTIKKDLRALPPTSTLVAALNEAAQGWISRLGKKGAIS
jgi:hypothetical protein